MGGGGTVGGGTSWRMRIKNLRGRGGAKAERGSEEAGGGREQGWS